eukprot:2652506-Rhodomonas_salina.1
MPHIRSEASMGLFAWAGLAFSAYQLSPQIYLSSVVLKRGARGDVCASLDGPPPQRPRLPPSLPLILSRSLSLPLSLWLSL